MAAAAVKEGSRPKRCCLRGSLTCLTALTERYNHPSLPQNRFLYSAWFHSSTQGVIIPTKERTVTDETTYLIVHEETEPEHDYMSYYEAVRALGPAQCPLNTLWFVRTAKSAEDIAIALKPHLAEADRLFVSVISLTKGSYSGWLVPSFWQWLSPAS